MEEMLQIEVHESVSEVVKSLPDNLRKSLNEFKNKLMNRERLDGFEETLPLSRKDSIGRRTGIRHYHLRPCNPVCYLVYVVVFKDTAYLLDISEHPPLGSFVSAKIEERLYPRLFSMRPELDENLLPSLYRSGLAIQNRDKYGKRYLKGRLSVAPVRGQDSDYIPLGQLSDFPEGRQSVPILAGTFDVSNDDIPEECRECIEMEEHPDREDLTLLRAKWEYQSGIYRPVSEQIVLVFCTLHLVVVKMNKDGIEFAKLEEPEFTSLFNLMMKRFPSVEDDRERIEEEVDSLLARFPLIRN